MLWQTEGNKQLNGKQTTVGSEQKSNKELGGRKKPTD